MTDPHHIRRKRLLYQATHRGFREADFAIGGFAAAHLTAMTAADLDAFEALLAFPDHDLYAWITGGAEPPPEAAGPMLARMQTFDISSITAP